MRLSERIRYVGVNDMKTELFEGQWPLPYGVSYNSYLVVDEKVALIDTAAAGFEEEFLANIKAEIGDRTVDYLVVNHMEPDHSALQAVIRREYPSCEFVTNAKAAAMIEGFHGITDNIKVVKEGESLSLGSVSLQFFMIPMVHWPETMVSWCPEENTLFSGDAFGTFKAVSDDVIDSKSGTFADYQDEMTRYYASIVGKYGSPVQAALKKLNGLEIKRICSTHGPVWENTISQVIALYDRLSRYDADHGVCLAYGSMYGNTEKAALDLAEAIKSKGIPCAVHNLTEEDYHSYVLCPRIELEALTTYKEYFMRNLSVQQKKEWSDPQNFTRWVKDNIYVNEDLNVTSVPISPMGVWESRVADSRSRGIFFVAVLRSLGIASRVDPVTGKIQYLQDGDWQDADFEKGTPMVKSQGTLYATYEPTKDNPNPRYYNHFTISKFEDGIFNLLSFDEGDIDMGGGTDYENMLKKGQKLDVGYYMMVSGSRQPDGSVLTHVEFFNIEENNDTHVQLQMRKKVEDLAVLGKLVEQLEYQPLVVEKNKVIQKELAKQKVADLAKDGWYIVAVLGVNEEPTNHAIRDIAAVKADFEESGVPLLLTFPDKDALNKFRLQDFPGLPSTITWGMDRNAAVQNALASSAKLANSKQLPIVVLANTDGRIVFVSQGYTIGLGEQLLKVIHAF